jgi:hypothetical protein
MSRKSVYITFWSINFRNREKINQYLSQNNMIKNNLKFLITYSYIENFQTNNYQSNLAENQIQNILLQINCDF